MTILARKLTPIPTATLLDVLESGHRAAYGYDLGVNARCVAASMLELEHGRRTVGAADISAHPDVKALRGVEVLWGVYCYNAGNHDAEPGDEAAGLPCFRTVPEREVKPDGKTIYYTQHTRRAYTTPEDGAEGYWRTIRDHFPEAYEAICVADPDAFCKALKARGYFPELLAKYERGVDEILARWKKLAAPVAVHDTEPAPPPGCDDSAIWAPRAAQ